MFFLGLLTGIILGCLATYWIMRNKYARAQGRQHNPSKPDGSKDSDQNRRHSLSDTLQAKNSQIKEDQPEYSLLDRELILNNEFFGREVVFVGELLMVAHQDAVMFVAKLGATVKDIVDADTTDIVVVGETPDSRKIDQVNQINQYRRPPIMLMDGLIFVDIVDKYFKIGLV
ncbi:MAG TPA: hypothetical protein P5228_03320 [Bacteroidales bacterium]|nr:hypothetical protein [Bacteroidales bacterium]